MRTRRTDLDVQYSVGGTLTGSVEQFTFTDNATGQADNISLTVNNATGEWLGAREPTKGRLVKAKFTQKDWDAEGDNKTLDCGEFTLDGFSAAGFPSTATIGAVATPADTAINETQRTATWNKTTIKNIAANIAARYSLTLFYEGDEIRLEALEQSGQTDSAFLSSLCKKYGLSMKLYRKKIVIFDREAYKKKDPVKTIRVSGGQGENFNLTSDLAGSYTGGRIQYTDPATEKDIVVEIGTGTRILSLNQSADDEADAKRQITAAVNNANHSITQVSLTIPGDASLISSQTITVTGLGQLSGKYYIDQTQHSIGSSGYTVSLSLSLVAAMTDAVVADACAQLAALGITNTPSYWVAHKDDVKSLELLLVNMATVIKGNAGGTGVTDAVTACDVLTTYKVMNSPDYWASKYSSLADLDQLLIAAANALEA